MLAKMYISPRSYNLQAQFKRFLAADLLPLASVSNLWPRSLHHPPPCLVLRFSLALEGSEVAGRHQSNGVLPRAGPKPRPDSLYLVPGLPPETKVWHWHNKLVWHWHNKVYKVSNDARSSDFVGPYHQVMGTAYKSIDCTDTQP
jgi:hypothetical protein